MPLYILRLYRSPRNGIEHMLRHIHGNEKLKPDADIKPEQDIAFEEIIGIVNQVSLRNDLVVIGDKYTKRMGTGSNFNTSAQSGFNHIVIGCCQWLVVLNNN